MGKKARLGLYLDDEEIKRRIKTAAAKKGVSTTTYCTEAIKERLVKEGEMSDDAIGNKRALLLARMDDLRQQIGPIGVSVSELIDEGRRR